MAPLLLPLLLLRLLSGPPGAPAPLSLLFGALGLFSGALGLYTGPLQPEISNGTFHHFFVPDGDYEETEDPERCQMLFRFSDRPPCGAEQQRDALVREDLVLARLQAEEAARLLESIGRTVELDLDGEQSYGTLLHRELGSISEAFSSVEEALQELEAKVKTSQESEQREEQLLSQLLLQQLSQVRSALRGSSDLSSGLRDRQELLSLIVRSHGTRLSRLKTQYLHLGS